MRSAADIDAFFALLRAGLWERGVRILPYGAIDFSAVYDLAEEQSVVGLVAAGLEHVEDTKVAKQDVRPFMKRVIALENRNAAMNLFIAGLVTDMQSAGFRPVLVKGQGTARCYARPQWRAAGDVDLFIDSGQYEGAKAYLASRASRVEEEDARRKHIGMTIDSWPVELHGTMHTEISGRLNAGIDAVQRDIFGNGGVRTWHGENADILLPSPDNDILIVFTHFVQHFYVGGVGLRQVSDWCRLLWTYRDEIDRNLLGRRLQEMGLLSEWKAFACFAVDRLGMPEESMPFYAVSARLSRKARRIGRLILKTGNFGHNQDQRYRRRYSGLTEKSITFFRRFGEFLRLTAIFPGNAPRFFLTYVTRRTKAASFHNS